MSRKPWRFFEKLAALTLLTIVGVSAQAAFIGGSWDPEIGGVYTEGGFRGEVTFFIPDDCLSTAAPGWYGNGLCGTGSMYLTDARIWLYDLTEGPPHPDLAGMPIVFSFSDPIAQLFGIQVAFNPDTKQSEVVGLDTGLIGPESTGYDVPVAPANLYLFFASGASDDSNPNFGIPGGAYLVPCEFIRESCVPIVDERSNPGEVTYRRVPLPGTLALLVAGLGAGLLSRRRRAVI